MRRNCRTLRDLLWESIRDIPGIQLNGDLQNSWPGLLNVSVADIEGESLLLALEPLCVATGSACNSTNQEPSYVLAITWAERRGCSKCRSDLAWEGRQRARRSNLPLDSTGKLSRNFGYSRRSRPRDCRPIQCQGPRAVCRDCACGSACCGNGRAQVLTRASVWNCQHWWNGAHIREARFRAWGCPHTIAACEAACADIEGGEVASLETYAVAKLMQSLAVPAEKSARILVIEDTVRQLGAALRNSGTP